MKNKVCIVVTIITVLMLAQFNLFIGNVKAETITGSEGTVSWSFDSETGTITFSGNGSISGDWRFEIDSFEERVKNVVIEDGITKLEQFAFQNCKSLKNIQIPNSVEIIESNALMDCQSLTSFTIPDKIAKESEDYINSWFVGCNSMEKIYVSSNNNSYSSVDGVLYNKNKTKIIYYPENKKNANYKILDGVTSIGEFAFSSSNLEVIEIPDSVTSIGAGAFSNTNIENIKIPNSVTSIGNTAFASCFNLKNVEIPRGVTKIESNTFVECPKLTNVVLPDTVISLEPYAFNICGITNFVIPNSVTSIGECAFRWCFNLNSIVIPNGITKIEDKTFQYCEKLTRIVIPDSVTEIGDGVFSNFDGGLINSNLMIIGKSNSKAIEYAKNNNILYTVDDDAPQMDIRQEKNNIVINATDDNGAGLSISPYSLDNKNWSSHSKIAVEKSGKYNVYVRDNLDNISNKEITIDLDKPIINNIKIEELKITVSAKDELSGLAEKAYSLDGENWQSSNEFVVNKAGKYTIYVCDVTGNIDTKTVEVIVNKEDDDKTEKEDKNPADNGQKNTNSKTSTETNDVKKSEDKTQAKTIIPQTGASFPIIALIGVSIIGLAGYKKFKKVNY